MPLKYNVEASGEEYEDETNMVEVETHFKFNASFRRLLKFFVFQRVPLPFLVDDLQTRIHEGSQFSFIMIF